MPRWAAIDLGTNTALCLVADLTPGGLSVVEDLEAITRLGEGVDRSRRLLPQAIARAKDAVAGYAARAKALGAERLFAVATSAARDAVNHDALVIALAEVGVELRIIGGDEEARLTSVAVRSAFTDLTRPKVVIDLGGGSTEVTYFEKGGAQTFRHSFDLGSVRLTERHVRGDPPTHASLTELMHTVRAAISELPPAPEGAEVIAVAATATTLCAVSCGAASSRAPELEGARLSLEELRRVVRDLSSLPLVERREVRGLDPRRADVIVAGGLLLQALLERLGAEGCRVTDRGLRFGVLIDLANREVRG